jgi:ATP-dependent Zn protease
MALNVQYIYYTHKAKKMHMKKVPTYNDLRKVSSEDDPVSNVEHHKQAQPTLIPSKDGNVFLPSSTDRDSNANESSLINDLAVRPTSGSSVLKTAEEMLSRYLGPKEYRIFAATHHVCKQFRKANTLHSTFVKKYKDTEKENISKLKSPKEFGKLGASLIKVVALIGDEMSMISPADLALIDSRMRQITNICYKYKFV